MKKLLLLNIVLTVALVIYIALTVALAIYVFTFVPPIGRAPIEPTPTWPSEGGWLAPGIWVGPAAPTDTPGPSPTPRPTSTAVIWQPPRTHTPTPLHSPTPTPTPSCDLTVYLRGTNNAEGFVAFSGEHVNAGWIYTEGAYVYGEIALRIGDREYHYYEQREPRYGSLSLLDGTPYHRMEFKFSDSLLRATEGVKPAFDWTNFRFWAGILDCNSATPPDKPYRIEATLYKGDPHIEEKIGKHTEISFFVVDDPLCDQP